MHLEVCVHFFTPLVQGRHWHHQTSPAEATKMFKEARIHGHTVTSDGRLRKLGTRIPPPSMLKDCLVKQREKLPYLKIFKTCWSDLTQFALLWGVGGAEGIGQNDLQSALKSELKWYSANAKQTNWSAKCHKCLCYKLSQIQNYWPKSHKIVPFIHQFHFQWYTAYIMSCN